MLVGIIEGTDEYTPILLTWGLSDSDDDDGADDDASEPGSKGGFWSSLCRCGN